MTDTAMTEALWQARNRTMELYFKKPPESDIINIVGEEVLACWWQPWSYDRGLAMWIEPGTGRALPGLPPLGSKKPVEAFYKPQTINADIAVEQHKLDWAESGIGLEGEIGKTIYVDGVARKLRGDRGAWAEQQRPLKRAEQKKRAKGWHPSMRNVTPRDHMTAEDREHFYRLARELMANLCHLTHYLPQCKILASKMTIRFLEAVEWEMINVAEWGQGLTKKIEDELRAVGAPHGPARVDGSDNLSVDRWEQQREGARFQYHWLQLMFKAWSDQMVDTFVEYGGIQQSTNYHGRLGVEHTGQTWQYVPVLQRQAEKKDRKADVDRLSAVARAELIGQPPEAFERFYEKRTGWKPRKGNRSTAKATPEVAQPMSESEASWMDESVHHAGYTFDDDGNVVD